SRDFERLQPMYRKLQASLQLRKVAILLNAGRFDEARRITNQRYDDGSFFAAIMHYDKYGPSVRANVLANLAQILAKVGRARDANSVFNDAEKVTAQTFDAAERDEAQDAMARALVGAGKLKRARTIADQMVTANALEIY